MIERIGILEGHTSRSLILCLLLGLSYALLPGQVKLFAIDTNESSGFLEEGAYPSAYELMDVLKSTKFYGSWNGSDANQAIFKSERFITQSSLKISVSGKPWSESNRTYLIDEKGNRLYLPTQFHKYYHNHTIVKWELSSYWQGRMVRLVCEDVDKTSGGWIGIGSGYEDEEDIYPLHIKVLASYNESMGFQLNGNYSFSNRSISKPSQSIFGSWNGSDSLESYTESYWFDKIDKFSIQLCGTPNSEKTGISLTDENGNIQKLVFWRKNEHILQPKEEIVNVDSTLSGDYLKLVIHDSSAISGGWIGISEPYVNKRNAIGKPGQDPIFGSESWEEYGSFQVWGSTSDANRSLNFKKWTSRGVSFFGSHSGDDNNRGILISPNWLPESQLFKIFICGTPFRSEGIDMILINTINKDTLDIRGPVDRHYAQWTPFIVHVPNSWKGDSIKMVIEDNASGWGAWVGVSSPTSVGLFSKILHILSNIPIGKYLSYSILFIVVLFPFIIITNFIRTRYLEELISVDWIFPITLILIGLVGYIQYFIYFFSQSMGCLSAIILIIVPTISFFCLPNLRKSIIEIFNERDFILPVIVMLLTGIFYISIMDLISSPIEVRFAHSMPPDNLIPEMISRMWGRGIYHKELFGSWLISDRPPLQSGIYLLTDWLWKDTQFGYQYVGVILQTSWISGAYILMKIMKVKGDEILIVLSLMICSGFFLVNTTYVWPKLLAGNYILVGLGMLYHLNFDIIDQSKRPFLILSFISFSLGYLSHGGVAFNFLAIGFLVLYIIYKKILWRTAMHGIVICLILLGSWSVFKTFHAPPGNRLLKMHLAGVHSITQKDVTTTITEAYKRTGWRQTIENKKENLFTQFMPERFFNQDPVELKKGQYFNLLNTMDILIIGFIVFLVQFLRRRKLNIGETGLLLLVILSTLFWILIMFQGGGCVLHQGSYATVLLLFLFLSLQILKGGRFILLFVWAIHVSIFLWIWVLTSPIDSPLYLNWSMVNDIDFYVFLIMLVTLIGYFVRKTSSLYNNSEMDMTNAKTMAKEFL